MESVTLAKVAGTYINLQDAYAVEANKMGSWSAIGYSAPGELKSGTGGATSAEYNTTNFKYTEGVVGTEDWAATANVKLNDCAKDTKGWGFKSVFSAGVAGGQYTLSYQKTTNAVACDGLTASFDNVIGGKH